MEQYEYHSSRRLCTLDDPGIALFIRYNPLTGKMETGWERCQYALARRVSIDCQHRPHCNGFAEVKPNSLMGRFLATCDCPNKVVVNDYVWLVDPPDREARHVDEEGRAHVVRNGISVSDQEVP
jgi:hypothetical protein